MGKRSKGYVAAEEEEGEGSVVDIAGIKVPTNILILATIIAFGGGAFAYFTYTLNAPVNPDNSENEFIKEIEENTYNTTLIFGNTTGPVALNVTKGTSEIIAVVFGSLGGSVEDVMNATIVGVEKINGEQWGANIIFKFKISGTLGALDSSDIAAVVEDIDNKVGNYLGTYKLYNGYSGKFASDTSPYGINEVYILSEPLLSTGDVFIIGDPDNVFMKKKAGQVKGIVAVDGYKLQSADVGIDATVVNITGASVFGIIKSNFNLKSLEGKVGVPVSSISHNSPKISIKSALNSEYIDKLDNLSGVSANITNNGSTTITLNVANVSGDKRKSYADSSKQTIRAVIGKEGNLTTESLLPLNKTEKIIIDEYSQFDCPACTRAVPTVHEVKEKYGDKIVFNFKHFAFHETAKKPAEASECARDQKKFWEYHDKLFENQKALTIENLTQYAEELGLDMEKFNKCLNTGEKEELIKADISEASSKGVSETPAFFVNGEQASWPQVSDIIKEKIIGKEKFVLNRGVSPEIKNTLNNLTQIKSVEVVDGETEISFNDSLEEIKSILDNTGKNYEIINGSLSFTLPEDADIKSTEKALEDFNITSIQIEKNGFVYLPKLVLISEMSTPLQDSPGHYINEHYRAILETDTKVGDKIKVEISATIQTMTNPVTKVEEKMILGLGPAVEMTDEEIKEMREKEMKEKDKTEKQKMKIAALKTNKGTIKFELYTDKAQKTTENFIKLANDGFYNGLIFHRVKNDFMIQCGGFYPNGTQKQSPYGAINLEIHPELVHDDGAVAMARTNDPNSATSQFYITDGPQQGLDGQYAVFGKVIEGREVVDSIASTPHDGSLEPNPGGGKPLEDIIIYEVTIENENSDLKNK